ncbi:gliding motility lipoprotein GldB [Flagellimonas myxillae]|uniref:gliding motility lipoprotein GldB n=1 Tax=Flagellimonas myxillae TaxID=2942214 RepID=UPI00201EB697|nr:gliding motility lipoprotein GldB [Muricauda myxillae]MCL6268081.1 gliding motility lipoprotein GldB [Muricauda myxillae]
MLIIKSFPKYFGILSRSGLILLGLLFLVIGCDNRDKKADEISKIPLELSVSRFDRDFADASPADLPRLKKRYPYLFPSQFPDSMWVAKFSDTIQTELSEEVDKAFGNFDKETEDLKSLFQHIKYYFPKWKVPKVVTVTSDVRYNDRVILTDTLLLLGLDNYLGPDHHFYGSIQRYIAEGLDKRYLCSDVASAFSKQVLKFPRNRTFLARMVYYGKELYLKDKLLPNATDGEKIGYSPEDLAWARDSESQIWRHFVENELLYSTDAKLDRRFLDPAPFSKFQLELDRDSPGRLGRYMGWQIVRAFMDKNEVTLEQMLAIPADEIFKKSNYKPKK